LGDAKGGHDKRELRIVGQTQENTQKQNDGRESDRSDQTLVNAGSTGRQEQHPASIADQNGHTAGGFGASGRNTISQSSMVVTASRLSTGLSAYRRPALINELPNCGQFAYEPLRTIPQKGRSHAAQIKAVGNSVFVPTAYALFLAIREALDTQGIEA
jgi:site-specific DNA-cytosine methylase